MRKVLLNLYFLLLAALSFGQTNHPKDLLKAYTAEELNAIEKESPENYQLLNYALKTGGYYLIDKPKEKSLQIDKTITLPAGKYNFATLGFKLTDDAQFIGINGSNKILVIKALRVIKNEFAKEK